MFSHIKQLGLVVSIYLSLLTVTTASAEPIYDFSTHTLFVPVVSVPGLGNYQVTLRRQADGQFVMQNATFANNIDIANEETPAVYTVLSGVLTIPVVNVRFEDGTVTPYKIQFQLVLGAGQFLFRLTAVEPVDVTEPPIEPPEAASCETAQVVIVNLSQDPLTFDSCIKEDDVQQCVYEQITDNLPDTACHQSFDVFVPGTAAEHGAWKQFNAMFNEVNGRGHLSLQYQDDVNIGNLNIDAIRYDKTVEDGEDSLKKLLITLRNRFPSAHVRVFGHSKGSHIVAKVADAYESIDNYEFYAFAQPGQTRVDAKLGRPGYIQKLSDNLVGITWDNDEVQYYNGGIPEKWQFPGNINQTTNSGDLAIQQRIDHHNNYGGRFIDGINDTDRDKVKWRDGEGATITSYPYCATGDRSVYNNDGVCKKTQIEYAPYFWGEPGCRAKAFEMMNTDDNVGARFAIGSSGPRLPDCSEDNRVIDVDYGLEYSINLGDQRQCKYNLSLNFHDINNVARGHVGRVEVSTTVDIDEGVKTGSIRIPIHSRLILRANMTNATPDTGSIFFNKCGSIAKSESYIKVFHITFTHPGTGKRIRSHVLVGNKEGRGYLYPIRLDGKNNVAWATKDSGDWDIHYALTVVDGFKPAIMIKGATKHGVHGVFHKDLHVID